MKNSLSTYVTFKIFDLFKNRLLPIVNEYRKDKDEKDIYKHIFLSPESYSKKRAFQVKGVLSPFVCLWSSSPLTYNKQFYSRSVLPQYFQYEEDDELVVNKGFLYDYEKKFELSASSYFADFRSSIEQDLLDLDRIRFFKINVDELLPGFSCVVELLLESMAHSDNVDQQSTDRSFDLGAKYNLKITLPVLSKRELYLDKISLFINSQLDYMREVVEVSGDHHPVSDSPDNTDSDNG